MSQWTHVIGAFRIDEICALPDALTLEKVKELIGPMCLFDAWDDKSTLPRGSEGSLHYSIQQYYTGMPWVIVTVWGDLRDYDDAEDIKKWWNSTLKLFPDRIRDDILRIDVESKPSIIHYNT